MPKHHQPIIPGKNHPISPDQNFKHPEHLKNETQMKTKGGKHGGGRTGHLNVPPQGNFGRSQRGKGS